MKHPAPPHLDSDEYAKWIILSMNSLKDPAGAFRQKELEEPPLQKAFRLPNDSNIQAEAETPGEWPESGPDSP
jgi:hypothetical protein